MSVANSFCTVCGRPLRAAPGTCTCSLRCARRLRWIREDMRTTAEADATTARVLRAEDRLRSIHLEDVADADWIMEHCRQDIDRMRRPRHPRRHDPPAPPRPCPVCGRPVPATRTHATYCSQACHDEAKRLRQREQRKRRIQDIEQQRKENQ